MQIVTDQKALAEPCTPLEDTSEVIDLIREVVAWVEDGANKALGVASTQAGSSLAWFVMRNTARKIGGWGTVNPGGKILAIANPKILKRGGKKVKRREGCLSIPGETWEVDRWSLIEVSYQEIDLETGALSKKKTGTFTGSSAQIFQHEFHHVRGKCIRDVGVKV